VSLSVLLAGGGTAGHVAPLLALADCLRRRDVETRVTVLGTAEGLEATLVPQAGYPLVHVPRVPLPRRANPELLRLPTRLRAAVAVASAAIEQNQVDVVVGFGGYVATPASPIVSGRVSPTTSRSPSREHRCEAPASSVCPCANRSPGSTVRRCAPRH
jgi:UDP-N-acetylglucosamine:LPS N-acetylglucosamine transferase